MIPPFRWSSTSALRAGLWGGLAWTIISNLWFFLHGSLKGGELPNEVRIGYLVISALLYIWFLWLIWRVRPGTRNGHVAAMVTLVLLAGFSVVPPITALGFLPLVFVVVPVLVGGLLPGFRTSTEQQFRPATEGRQPSDPASEHPPAQPEGAAEALKPAHLPELEPEVSVPFVPKPRPSTTRRIVTWAVLIAGSFFSLLSIYLALDGGFADGGSEAPLAFAIVGGAIGGFLFGAAIGLAVAGILLTFRWMARQ